MAIPASVYTFGFGDDHDPDMLKAISDAGNGMYYFIENEDKVAFIPFFPFVCLIDVVDAIALFYTSFSWYLILKDVYSLPWLEAVISPRVFDPA